MANRLLETLRMKIGRSLNRKLPREIAVISVSSRDSKKINRTYRKRDKPANVLSFRYDGKYGEILICPEVIKKEAKFQGNSYKYHCAWMILHGILHLAGMHHESSKSAAGRVEKLEQKILSKIFK